MGDDDYSECIISIDRRERDQDRIKEVTDFFESHGSIVQMESSHRCDYHIEGIVKGVPINLGIEHKVLTGDFFPSLDEIPSKLFEAYRIFDDVALFVEEGNYSIKMTDDGLDCWIQEPKMQAMTGAEGVGTMAMYQNTMGSLAEAGIHCRSFRTVKHFPITISGLIKNLVKPIHRGIAIKNPEKSFYPDMMNILAKLPGIGAKTAEKGLKYIPNLERFCSLGLDDLKDIFGEVSGRKLYSFITNDSRKAECAKNWEEYYQTVREKHQPKSKERVNSNSKIDEKAESKHRVTPAQKKVLNRKDEAIATPSQQPKNPALEFLNEYVPQYIEITDDSKKWYPIILEFIQSQPEGIMLSDIVKANPKCPEQIIFKLIQEYMNAGEAYEPKIGKIMATNLNVYVEKVKQSEILSVVEATPIVESPLPELPDGRNYTKRELGVRITDIDLTEYIRRKPRTLDEIGKYFMWSPEFTLKSLYLVKEKGKIWYDSARKVWDFGKSKEPMPIVADKALDVGV